MDEIIAIPSSLGGSGKNLFCYDIILNAHFDSTMGRVRYVDIIGVGSNTKGEAH